MKKKENLKKIHSRMCEAHGFCDGCGDDVLCEWIKEQKEFDLSEHDKHILGEFVTRLLCVVSHKCDFYTLENGNVIEAMGHEEIDKLIYETLDELGKGGTNDN